MNRRLFGKEAEIVVYDVEPLIAEEMIDACYEEALRLHKIFNFYDSSSELSILNKTRSIKASNELFGVLKETLKYSKISQGLYDVSLGKHFLQRKLGKPLTAINCSFEDIELKDTIIRLNNPEVLVDLGSIAKGFIVDSMIAVMESHGLISGFIDARGDMRVFGSHDEIVEVQHPRSPDKILDRKSVV